MTLSVGVIRLT